MATILSSHKNCVTCKNWGGTRQPADRSQTFIDYDNNGKGKCYGSGPFSQQSMSPMQTCVKWEQQYGK
jgi:hypothetical protein